MTNYCPAVWELHYKVTLVGGGGRNTEKCLLWGKKSFQYRKWFEGFRDLLWPKWRLLGTLMDSNVRIRVNPSSPLRVLLRHTPAYQQTSSSWSPFRTFLAKVACQFVSLLSLYVHLYSMSNAKKTFMYIFLTQSCLVQSSTHFNSRQSGKNKTE